ncbi:MAG: metalloregulator ArsR/SmtB family transcription factor [Bacillota bacterium]
MSDSELREKILFSYSPIIEMVISLDVLSEPRFGVLLPWVVRLKEKAYPRFGPRLRELSGQLRRWVDLALVLPEQRAFEAKDVRSFLDEMATVPPEGFCRQILGPEPWEVDPAQWPQTLIGFLGEYWDGVFRDEFLWIEQMLLRSVKEEASRLGRASVYEVLTRVLNGEAKVGTRTIAIVGYEDQPFAYEDYRRIIMVPSVFAPPTAVLVDEEGILAMTYPVNPGRGNRDKLTPPESLSRLLRALGDETRMKILKLILESRHCTRDLAVELELSEPTISKHVKILKEADLISSEREGNYIYYSLRLERIAELQMKVLDFLRS